MKTSSLEDIYKVYLKHPQIVKDTREITPECLFVALKGENFDANEFAEESIKKGAAYAIIDNPNKKLGDQYILVDDVLKTLQELARIHRKNLSIPVLGITGSNGKTTNKELILSVLSQKYNTLATSGNYNNHIGVPLTILRINKTHEFAIIEMGANHQKEIEFLCSIADPNFGLITNIGKAHLEGFGGIEGVKKGKSELYRHIEQNYGTTFINGDDEVLNELSNNDNQISYGLLKDNDCVGKLQADSPNILGKWSYKLNNGDIKSSLFGKYNFYNIMAAICIGNYFDVESSKIDIGIQNYNSKNNRSEITSYRGSDLYLDAYNANPSSMEASINHFKSLEGEKKILILGDMYEIGEQTDFEHEKVILLIKKLGLKTVFFIGELFTRHIDKYPEYSFFSDRERMKKELEKLNLKGSKILVKASRGMALEKIFQ